MRVRKQQLELDMEQQTGSRLGKEYVKAVYCHPAYLTYIQSTSCEMLDWMNHKVNQDCREKYQQPQICRWHHSSGRKWKWEKSEVTQSCPTLWDPVDCSPPGSSNHGIFQARILEWVAIPFFRGSSWPRSYTQSSLVKITIVNCLAFPTRLCLYTNSET